MATARKEGAARVGNRGNAGKGRRKGSQNKVTRAFKEAVLLAFHELEGVDGLVTWGRANRTEFYKIAARLIPHEVVGPGAHGEHLVQQVVVELHPALPAPE